MDYLHTFANRIEKFMYAVNTYPHSMENEFIATVNELDVHDNEVVAHLGAGGVHIRNHISNHITYYPFDFSEEWHNVDKDIIYTTCDRIPLENESVDKIIVLAILHHFTDEERSILYKECHRILKKSGKMVIADVIKNSTQDVWLNNIVNQYNPDGHHGRFFDSEDAKLMESNQFHIEIKNNKYCWWFNSEPEMLDYLKNFFNLTISDEEILHCVNEVLKPYTIGNRYYVDWELIYFICSPLDP